MKGKTNLISRNKHEHSSKYYDDYFNNQDSLNDKQNNNQIYKDYKNNQNENYKDYKKKKNVNFSEENCIAESSETSSNFAQDNNNSLDVENSSKVIHFSFKEKNTSFKSNIFCNNLFN